MVTIYHAYQICIIFISTDQLIKQHTLYDAPVDCLSVAQFIAWDVFQYRLTVVLSSGGHEE